MNIFNFILAWDLIKNDKIKLSDCNKNIRYLSIMFKLLIILLSLKAINSLKYKLNEIVTGLPRAFEYETVYSNDDSNGKTRAAFSYYISVSTVEDYPIYFVAGLKEDVLNKPLDK
ncbi:hypothetical protein MHBO_003187 [Bonamia ostreae]|uniref:Uncharacterized protein n=1 Tax=Bonamia ostreae TaxID=126728 RepID=A0ABV2APP9_9EUKA